MNKYITQNKKLHTCIVDLEKAFDTAWRIGLLHKIRKLGIAGKMFDIIKSIYGKTSYSIIINGNLATKSSCTKGIKQDDTLLLNIYLNNLLEYLSKDSNDPVIIDNTELSSLMFADDLALVSTTVFNNA